MASERNRVGDLALWAMRHAERWARGVQRGQPSNGWESRTASRHTDRDGGEWAVVVDWATDRDGTPVPASVTLSSVGGTLGDPQPPDAGPRAVSRALVESVPWGTVIWGSRSGLTRHVERTDTDPTKYEAPPSRAAQSHDDRLRHVAEVYRAVGGAQNPHAARDVWEVLGREGVAARGGGALTRTRVRTWLLEARRRGYITEPSGSQPDNRKGRQ